MKVSDYIVEFLIENGVNHVFGYPGGMVTHLLESFSKYSNYIQVHTNYHEQASSFAANGYAQASEKLGVAYSSSGPGVTNMITGICNAYFDSIPVLFLTGQVNTYESKGSLPVRQRGFQETDIIPLVNSITKYCSYIDHETKIRYELEKAFHLAMEGRKGPVLLDIPMNIQRMEIAPEKLIGFCPPPEIKKEVDITPIIDALNKSHRPVILIGAGTKIFSIRKLVNELVAKSGIPAVSSMIAMDVIPDAEESYYGFLGAYGSRTANFIVAKSDLILSICSRLDVRQVGGKRENFAPNAQIIRIDIDEGELAYSVNDRELKILGDAEEILLRLCKENICTKNKIRDWLSVCEEIKKTLKNVDQEIPNKLVEKISKLVPSDYTITTDVGQNQVWIAQSFITHANQKVLFSGGLGTMGYSLPAAIGAYYGSQNPVVSFHGDGGLQMNIQELQFIVREKLPIAIILFNNHALGMIRHFQEMYFDSNYMQTVDGNGYEAPNFKKIANAYGLEYYAMCPSDTSALKKFEDTMKELKAPVFWEIMLDFPTHVFPKLEYGKPNQDQEPLIERDTFKRLMNL